MAVRSRSTDRTGLTYRPDFQRDSRLGGISVLYYSAARRLIFQLSRSPPSYASLIH